MNYWERRRKYALDAISAMVSYANSINPDKESQEYKEALLYWADNLSDKYKEDWEKQHK